MCGLSKEILKGVTVRFASVIAMNLRCKVIPEKPGKERKNVHGVVDDWCSVIAKNVTTRLNSLTRRAIHIGEGCKRGIQL